MTSPTSLRERLQWLVENFEGNADHCRELAESVSEGTVRQLRMEGEARGWEQAAEQLRCELEAPVPLSERIRELADEVQDRRPNSIIQTYLAMAAGQAEVTEGETKALVEVEV
jgi:hypothetical protein